MLMYKKKILLWIIFSGLILISGCETAKGAAEGVAYGIGSTAVGVSKDAKGLWHGIMEADNWIKKNLW